jgi:hypothetical protein
MRGGIGAGMMVLLAAPLLGGCSEEKAAAPDRVVAREPLAPDPVAAREPLAPVSLPTSETLPVGVNRGCGCLRGGQCAMLDEIFGNFETRNLSCRWVRVNQVAQCRYEERFVALHSKKDGTLREEPSPWRAVDAQMTLLPNGVWCLGT